MLSARATRGFMGTAARRRRRQVWFMELARLVWWTGRGMVS